MLKQFSFLWFTLMVLCVSCIGIVGPEDETDTDWLPREVTSFIASYLSEFDILKAEIIDLPDDEHAKYKVAMSEGLTLVFNTLGFPWTAESDTRLPVSLVKGLLSADELDVLTAMCPDMDVKGYYFNVYVSGTGYQKNVVIGNGKRLWFHFEDDKLSLAEDVTGSDDLPAGMDNMIRTAYPDFNRDLILFVTKDKQHASYYLALLSRSPGPMDSFTSAWVGMTFGIDGNWLSVVNRLGDSTPMPDVIFQTLSEYVRGHISTYLSGWNILGIAKNNGRYDLSLLRGENRISVAVSFDLPPAELSSALQTFVDKHFGGKKTEYGISAYRKSENPELYACYMISDSLQVFSSSTINGTWQVLMARQAKFIPKSLYDESLPPRVWNFLVEANILHIIDTIIKNADGTFTLGKSGVNPGLLFDAEGNYVRYQN